jgi:folate-binding protein YgfZ
MKPSTESIATSMESQRGLWKFHQVCVLELIVPESCRPCLAGSAYITARVCAGTAIPLEYNIDWLNGVSYDKGCYVGQELVARVHFGGLVRKRLYPVSFEQPLGHSNVEDIPVFLADKETSIGTLRVRMELHTCEYLMSRHVSRKVGNFLCIWTALRFP